MFMETILSNLYSHQSHWDNTKLFRLFHNFFLFKNDRYSTKKFFLLLIHIHFVVIHIFVSSDKPERLHLRLLILQIKITDYCLHCKELPIFVYTFTWLQKLYSYLYPKHSSIIASKSTQLIQKKLACFTDVNFHTMTHFSKPASKICSWTNSTMKR